MLEFNDGLEGNEGRELTKRFNALRTDANPFSAIDHAGHPHLAVIQRKRFSRRRIRGRTASPSPTVQASNRFWPSSRGSVFRAEGSADDPLLLAHRPSIQRFLAVIQRSVFRDEGSLFDVSKPGRPPSLLPRLPLIVPRRRRLFRRSPSAYVPEREALTHTIALPPTQPRRGGIS